MRRRAGCRRTQVFDLLVYLVQHHDRFVSKDDLLQAVWGGRIVSDAAVAARINAARRALGDNGKAQRWIRTLPRKGVRFMAPCARSQRLRRHRRHLRGYRSSCCPLRT